MGNEAMCMNLKMAQKSATGILAVLVLMLAVLVGQEAFAVDTEKILNMSEVLVLPDPQALEEIKNNVGNTATASDALASGFRNSMYQSSLDTPITRFVLGKIRFNLTGLASLYAELEKKTDEAIWSSYTLEDDTFKGLIYEDETDTEKVADGAMSSIDWAYIEDILNDVQKIFSMFEVKVPLLLLCVFFVVQLAVIMYHYALGTEESMRISVLHILPRFMLFFILVATYQQWVSGAITMANYVSNFVCSHESQKTIVSLMWEYATTNIEDGGIWLNISGILLSFFQWLTYACIMIMLVVRDVLLAITVLVGGLCMAMGFVTTYSAGDPMREYLAGWFKSFIRLLLWGVFSSAVIYSLGILTLLRASGSVNILFAAIFALSSLYVAKDLPNLAEKMSGLALTSLLATIAPAITKTAGRAIPSAMSLSYYGIGRAAAGAASGASRLIQRAQDMKKQAPPIVIADTGAAGETGPSTGGSLSPSGATAGKNKKGLTDIQKVFHNAMAGIDLHSHTFDERHNQALSDEDLNELEETPPKK